MSYPSVQFVASPDAGAAVLVDCNVDGPDVSVRTLHDGFSLGMASLAGDAGARGRSWGLRQGVSIPLQVEGSRAAALAALRPIARAATRDGWVRVQLDAASAPVWHRVHASEPDPLDWELIFDDRPVDRWGLKLPMVADAFGVGERIVLWSGSLTNTPVGAAWEKLLPPVVGEMPAPAEVKVSRSSWMLGTSVARSSIAQILATGASWSGSVAATADAAYLSTGGRRQTNAGSFTTWGDVVTYTPAGSAGGKQSLIRVSGSANAGAFALRWKIASGGSTLYTDPVVVSCATMLRWVTLGRVPFPLSDPNPLGGGTATTYTLQAKRVAAGGELRFDDRLVLLAVDEPATLLRTQPDDVGAVATTVLAHSEDRQAYMLGGTNLARTPDFSGGWPLLWPGEDNRLVVLQNLDPRLVATRDDSITATATVEVAYRPRYLWGI